MFLHALPFTISLVFVPAHLLGLVHGGWWIALGPAYGYVAIAILDRLAGRSEDALDPMTEARRLIWHRLITWIWLPVQIGLILATLIAVFRYDHLSTAEAVLLAMALGVITGGVGINYAHELIHQRNRWERRLGRALLITTLYGHFETEHLHVHHRLVATPRDPVTARYNEPFFRFFPRVLWGCLIQAWQVERDRLARRGRPVWHASNPFWQYGGGAAACLGVAHAIGGWGGVGLYLLQALVAVYHLEIVNYVEHYGLTRKHLGGGRYEPVRPRHSWNAAQTVSNWLLINLQRHSDHHYKPDRRFPLLQSHDRNLAPQLPYSYPVMCLIAAVPPLFLRMMNPRVRKWRSVFYPEITDWRPYSAGTLPVAA
ncbi:MAG: alkane 1-monooxygenase [Alphaproteobacteria bacterium]|nr:MAG: alkane 1-monooxygenase [Alphaproteobacteria bacterium]